MKKLLGIIVLGLLLSGNAYAECIKGDCINGQATFIMNDGGKYVGEWKNGLRTGQGTYIFTNGDKYVGGYKNDKRNGYGTYFFADGRLYAGGWKDYKKHGQGTFTYPNGEKVVGVWKNDYLTKTISRSASVKDKADKKIDIASMIDKAKNTCKELGFSEGTEKFSDCSLKLYSQSVELAAEQNKTVVMQPQSSGSNVMTIYDPVRDNQRMINQGMKMLSGRCTLGIDC